MKSPLNGEIVDALIERVLSRDPSVAYLETDAITRQQWRTRIRLLAQQARMSPEAVASLAVELAMTGQTSATAGVRGHVGYYLTDGAGAFELQRALRVRLGLVGIILRRPLIMYVSLVGILSVGLLVFSVMYALDQGANAVTAGTIPLIALPLYFHTSVMLTQFCLRQLVPPRLLPRLTFADGIPDDCRTLVTVPCVISSVSEVATLGHRLEALYDANPDDHVRFALLSDFADSNVEVSEEDEGILTALGALVTAMNDKYAGGFEDKFFVLHRERHWNAAQDAWMGWERKRGKLEELLAMLDNPGTASFRWIYPSRERFLRVGRFRYMLVLDEDTFLGNGEVHDLVRTAAHPLNSPTYDATGRPARGYGILQPDVTMLRQARSLYAFLLGTTFPDPKPIRGAQLSIEFDLFGEVCFHGKGLYDVAACAARLVGTMPENLVLQHDALDGFYARTAYVGDVIALEPTPTTYLAHLGQIRRWVRGEAQWLLWTLPRVPGRGKALTPSPLSSRARWVLGARVVHRLSTCSSVALMIAGWLFLPGEPWVWTILGMMPLLVSLLLECLHISFVAVPNNAGSARPSIARGVFAIPVVIAGQAVSTIFATSVLAIEAVAVFVAVSQALWRVIVSHRHLLDWTPQSHEQRMLPASLLGYGVALFPSSVMGLVGILLIQSFRPERLSAAAPLLLLWISAFLVVWLVDQPVPALLRATGTRRV